MIGNILQFDDLQRMCRPNPEGPLPRLATVVRWAENQGIMYKYDGQGGIWTTMDALNSALGLAAENNSAPYDPIALFGKN